MQKKIPVKTLYLLLVISIGLIGLGVGSTFAMFTATAEINNPIIISSDLAYSNDIVETVDVNIPAGQTKTITLNVHNSSSDTLNYTAWYMSDSNKIEIGKDDESSPNTIGTLSSGNSVSVKVKIRNYGNSTANLVVGVSSSESSVVLGNNMKVVPNLQIKIEVNKKAAEYISDLFSKTGTVTENPTGGTNAVTLDVDTTHQLIKDKAGNIRYYGTGITSSGGTYKEPNNYIDIGDRDSSNNPILWRIIGVFKNVQQADGTSKDLIKVIRSTPIGGYSWDTSVSTINSGRGINEWSQADMMKLLNPGFTGIGGSLWYNHASGKCYNSPNNATIDCDFTSSGLSDKVKDYIANVVWNTGGYNSSSVYPNQIYTYERGTTLVPSPADGITRNTTWTGKVAIPYPSDYGYATDLQQCTQTLNVYNNAGENNTYPCRGNNWMWYTMNRATSASTNAQYLSRLLTPYSGQTNGTWFIYDDGHLSPYDYSCFAYLETPVLYLKPDVLFKGNYEGTQSNPYKIYTEPQPAATVIKNLYSKTETVTENPTGGANAVVHDVDTAHNMIKDKAGNIRYYGKNPDNYIDIGDNVFWRIIGVFDNKLKLIRSESIGYFSWDTSASTINEGKGINEWSQSDVMKLLNPGYTGTGGSLWYNHSSGNCYNGNNNTTKNCDFTTSGLSDSVKDRITEINWNTGGFNNYSLYPTQMYNLERGTTVISNPGDGITRQTTWRGLVGLAYASDYGYATDLSKCAKTLFDYDSSENSYACRGNNWMRYLMTNAVKAETSGSNAAWLMTPDSSNNNHSWYITTKGVVYNGGGSNEPFEIVPVIYLDSEQKIKSGAGTQSNPYELS